MLKERLSRRDLFKFAGQAAAGGVLSSLGTGCLSQTSAVEGKEIPTNKVQQPSEKTPTSSVNFVTATPPSAEASASPTETIPTAEVKPTLSSEAIVFPQTEISSELSKQIFTNIGGPGETVDLSKIAASSTEETRATSWQTIEGYTSFAWDEKINLADLAQDEIKANQALIALGAQAGVEGFYQPGEILPQAGDLTLLRLTINQLPNNQDFYDARLNSSPQNLVIRKGTHLTVLGLWADASGRWATVAIDEGFDRDKQGIQPRDVPRHFLTVIPQDLPPESEGLSLEKLVNSVPGWFYQAGVVEHHSPEGKIYYQELNIIEPNLAKKLEQKAGALFMDQKKDGSWYENPVVPYPPSEQKSIHQVKPGETLSKIAQDYGLTIDEILKANPEIKDPSKINVGQEINIVIPGFTDYHGPSLKEDGRIVILSHDQTKELAEAVYNEQTKQWEWKATAVVEPTEEQPTATVEARPTREPGALYEEDFPHLRKEGGEWKFGEIAGIEETKELGGLFSLAGVILSGPEKRTINALDGNGNIIYTYENWFVKVGYPDPQEGGGKLVTGEVMIWNEGVTPVNLVVYAKDGFIESRLPGGTGYDNLIWDRDQYFANFKYGEPAILEIGFSSPDGIMSRELQQYASGEAFPGSTQKGKNIYFFGLMLDEENGIGRLDLPPLPTIEEIRAWQEGKQLPNTNFLGWLNRLMIPGK